MVIAHSSIRDITGSKEAQRLPEEELIAFAELGISVSDTETTGLARGRHGLTEIGSIRAIKPSLSEKVHGNDKPHLMAFHQFILPLKPQYQDYLAACAANEAAGKPPPPYDRKKYEYAIDPRALAVTGTEIVRDQGLNGPITGLKVRTVNAQGQQVITPVDAVPFYKVATQFMEFTRNGDQDVYYNAPFDLPFLGKLIADVYVDKMLREERYRHEAVVSDERFDKAQRVQLREMDKPYDVLSEGEKESLRGLLTTVIDVPAVYTNSAQFRCLLYGNLVANGFGVRNTLDDVYKSFAPDEAERGDHSAVEDVVMAARVALRQAEKNKGEIHTITELFGDLLKRVDPKGQTTEAPARPHSNGNKDEPPVVGDIILKFSDDPKSLGEKAQRFWEFLAAFDEVTLANDRAPHHLVDIDSKMHTVTINAERKDTLSLRFLKKTAYFHQLMKQDGVVHSFTPFDSTGTVMDVTLKARDGSLKVVEDVPYGSLRANTAFLEKHPEQAEDYLRLIRVLTKTDKSVGPVVLREEDDGGVSIIVKGHLRGFGECMLRMPKDQSIADATEGLAKELQVQLRIGAIPHVSGFGQTQNIDIRDDEDSAADAEAEDKREETSKLEVQLRHMQGEQVTLTLSPEVFACMAMRLRTNASSLLERKVIPTTHGDLTIVYSDAQQRYSLTGKMDALHDFVDLDRDETSPEPAKGEKPSNLIRDASWMLYRLQRMDGTFRVRVDGHMGVLEQDDGVSLEAMAQLTRLGIPFKAYDREIKIDLAQLMKNAFHYSVELKRDEQQRKKDMERVESKQEHRPPAYLQDAHYQLLEGNAEALEVNEEGKCWLLDHSKAMHGQPQHHLLEMNAYGVPLVFKDKQLVAERSGVQGILKPLLRTLDDGSLDVRLKDKDSPLLLELAAHRLAQQKVDVSAFVKTDSPYHWIVPAPMRGKVMEVLDEASRFTYWMSKATGSERQLLDGLKLDTPQGVVRAGLPEMQFMQNPQMLTKLLAIHATLSNPALFKQLRTLRNELIDTRLVDPRRADLFELSESTRGHAPVLRSTSESLEGHIDLLGSPQNPVKVLKEQLTTLGVLLHDVKSIRSRQTIHSHDAVDEGLDALAIAQERLSQVVHGMQHLEEDMAVVRAKVTGTERTGGLLQEIGVSMARVLEDKARAVAQYDKNANLWRRMQPYMQEMSELLGIESGNTVMQQIAQQAADRYLSQMAVSSDTRIVKERVADYLLHEAFPDWKAPQRKEYIKERVQEAAVAVVSSRVEMEDKPYYKIPFEKWKQQHANAIETVDARIKKAFERKGKYYLQLARHDGNDFYLAAGNACLLEAGWDEARIGAEKQSRLTYRKEMLARAAIEERVVSEDTTKLKDLLDTIELPEHAERAREKMLRTAYHDYMKSAVARPSSTGHDYELLKQRKALLSDIANTREEVEDLSNSLPHFLRDISGLIVMLQQDPAMAAMLGDDGQRQIGEIAAKIHNKPEIVGIDARPVARVRELIDHHAAAMKEHLDDVFTGKGASPQFEEGKVKMPLVQVKQMFDRWQMQELETPEPVKQKSILSVDADLAKQHPLLAHPEVRRLCFDKDAKVGVVTGSVVAGVTLPQRLRERREVWGKLKATAVDSGLMMPAMPRDKGEIHEVPIAVIRGKQKPTTQVQDVQPVSSRQKARDHRRKEFGKAIVGVLGDVDLDMTKKGSGR